MRRASLANLPGFEDDKKVFKAISHHRQRMCSSSILSLESHSHLTFKETVWSSLGLAVF